MMQNRMTEGNSTELIAPKTAHGAASLLAAALVLVCVCALPVMCAAQNDAKPEVVLLWPQGAPLAQGTAPEDQPRITVYMPKQQALTHPAVVVCPGGGYAGLAMDHEGKQIAAWLNSQGVAAFVLEYRLGKKYHYPAQKFDVLRAMRYVRSHATQYGVAPERIGVWGFSAGGHLASMAATLFDAGDAAAADPIDRVSSRPDFAILDYPVIAGLGDASEFSFRQLLGEHPTAEQIAQVSSDLNVTPQTPPTFLVHSDDDRAVLSENSVRFYLALRKAGVPAEMHILHSGGHGYGLGALDPALSLYTQQLVSWLRFRGVL